MTSARSSLEPAQARVLAEVLLARDPDLLAIARRVCTAAEQEVLDCREALEREGRDCGYRSVAKVLGLAWTTVRDRTKRAEARIARALNEGGAE